MENYRACSSFTLVLMVLGIGIQLGCGGPPPPPPMDAAVEAEIVKHDEMISDQEASL